MVEHKSPNGWTLDTLEKYLTEKFSALTALSNERESRNVERFAAARENVAIAMTASEKAVGKAENAQEKRNEGLNEFRQAMLDQQKTFSPKSETDFRFLTLENRVQEITASLATRLEKIDQVLAANLGKSQGVGMTISGAATLVGVVAAVATVVGVVIAFLAR